MTWLVLLLMIIGFILGFIVGSWWIFRELAKDNKLKDL